MVCQVARRRRSRLRGEPCRSDPGLHSRVGLPDDMIIVPLGLALALKMIPREVMEEHRREARGRLAEGVPRRWVGAVVVICIWILLLWLVAYPLAKRLLA